MVIPARLRLVLAAAGIVPTAACGGATPSRPKPTDTTAVASPTTLTPTTSAPEVVPTASGADSTTTTEPETVTTVTIAAPPAAPATTRTTVTVAPFVLPERGDEAISDAEWWARQGRAARGDGPYNGWAIPEYIVMCESGGNWNAYNSSGAAGPYQLMPAHFGSDARNFSQAEQHAMAANLWAGGAGASNWAECL